MEKIEFTKMHGAGNDYVYINATDRPAPADLPSLARRISHRHFGVGGDGLVVIMPSEKADFRMRMFNADGSEAQMCGNASRCIAKYVYEKRLTSETTVTLETLAGIKTLRLKVSAGKVEEVEVDMGIPVIDPALVPAVSADGQPLRESPVRVGDEEFLITAVGMGNPHGVIFTDEITDEQVLGKGPRLETADIWPEKANIEFVKVIDRGHIRMRVWERGTGETLACGTGACASAMASILTGRTGDDVRVSLPGGELRVRFDRVSGHLFLCGGAEFVADGVYYPESYPDYFSNENQ